MPSERCAVCGRSSTSRVYKCSDFTQALQDTFGVHTGSDAPGSHPELFCRACHDVIRTREKANKGSKVYKPVTQCFNQWCLHSDGHCAVCEQYSTLSKGGQPKKLSSKGGQQQSAFGLQSHTSEKQRHPLSFLMVLTVSTLRS